MYDNNTWKLVSLPKNARAIDYKWIFRLKDGNSPAEPPRFKARLVAKAFSKKEGIDYNDIFVPVVKYKTMRLLLAMSTIFNWEIDQMDVKTAFLNGDLEETIFMKQPKGFIDKQSPDRVCYLNKSIYGLKQSLIQWNRKFDACMTNLAFSKSKYDSCLYLKNMNAKYPSFVVLYVDDMLIISESRPIVNNIKSDLKKHFDMKDLGTAQRILGVRIIRDKNRRLVYLSQSDYLDKVHYYRQDFMQQFLIRCIMSRHYAMVHKKPLHKCMSLCNGLFVQPLHNDMPLCNGFSNKPLRKI
ncbi:unnamed protein product [Rhodiola kirilowii]